MMRKTTLLKPRARLGTLVGVLSLLFVPAQAQQKLKQTFQTQGSIDNAAQQSQIKIDKLADKTADLLADYRITNRQIDNLNIYNKQLEKIIGSQNGEIDSLNNQINQIDETAQNVIPLMQRMIKALDEFVKLDIPFYKTERADRIIDLYSMMDASNITTSEKFRRVIEAYTIENDYGREAVSNKATLDNGDAQPITVNYLRLGRLSYVYLTLDEKSAGYWDKQSRQWSELPASYISSIHEGIKITKKRAIPDIIKLPVATAQVQQ